MGGHIQGCLYLKTGKVVDCHCAEEERHYWGLARRSFASFLIQAMLGFVSGSLGLLADAVHQLVDGAENIVSALVARTARRSSDENKIRGLGGLASAILIMIASFWIIGEAMERLVSPRSILIEWALGGVAVGLAINIWQLIDHSHVHEEHKNVTHWWQWVHLILDVGASVVALTGLGLVTSGYPLADTTASLVIVGIIWFLVAMKFVHGRRH